MPNPRYIWAFVKWCHLLYSRWICTNVLTRSHQMEKKLWYKIRTPFIMPSQHHMQITLITMSHHLLLSCSQLFILFSMHALCESACGRSVCVCVCACLGLCRCMWVWVNRREKETWWPGAAKLRFINVIHIEPNKPWSTANIIMSICT